MKNVVNIIVLLFMISCSFFGINLLYKGVSTLDKTESKEENVNINKKEFNIDNIKNDYGAIFYEYENIDFVSFITTNDDYYHETVIIDNKTGEKLKLESLIKEDYLDEFWDKVYDLLNLKYPKFIVDGLMSSDGNIYYEIKENEMIIYFEYFSFDVNFPETISIKINYNEVKEYLNFSYKLDDEYLNESAYDYDKNKKTIALTFDDGPNAKYTKELVDIFNNNKAKATFFMLGSKMQQYPSNLLYVYNNGFEIGSHTFKHINMKRVSINEIKLELNKTNEIYNSITKDNIKLVRPPYGAYNDKILSSIDYPFIMWNIDTNDWRYHDKDYIVNHILENVKDGSIILMHDSYETTIEAVKEVLPKLYAKGYQLVTVSDLVALKGVSLNNHEVYSYIK